MSGVAEESVSNCTSDKTVLMGAIAISAINFKEPKITRLRIERVLIWAKPASLMTQCQWFTDALYRKFPSRLATNDPAAYTRICHFPSLKCAGDPFQAALWSSGGPNNRARVRGEQSDWHLREENSRLQPAANFPVRVCIRRASSRRGLGWKEPRGESTLSGGEICASPPALHFAQRADLKAKCLRGAPPNYRPRDPPRIYRAIVAKIYCISQVYREQTSEWASSMRSNASQLLDLTREEYICPLWKLNKI